MRRVGVLLCVLGFLMFFVVWGCGDGGSEVNENNQPAGFEGRWAGYFTYGNVTRYVVIDIILLPPTEPSSIPFVCTGLAPNDPFRMALTPTGKVYGDEIHFGSDVWGYLWDENTLMLQGSDVYGVPASGVLMRMRG